MFQTFFFTFFIDIPTNCDGNISENLPHIFPTCAILGVTSKVLVNALSLED